MSNRKYRIALLSLVLLAFTAAFAAIAFGAGPASQPATKPVPAVPTPPFSVNVKDYGAIGNGIHDDAVAIQKATDALSKAGHGRLRFEPFGVYRLGKAIVGKNISDFEIDGQGATIKPLDTVTVLTADGDSLRLVACSRFSVHDLSFDGNRTKRGAPPGSTTPETLRLQGCTDFVIHDCRFRDSVCDDLFLWCNLDPTNVNDHCQFGRVTGCTFDDPWRNSISVIHGAFIQIDHNIFRDAHTSAPCAGIDVEPNLGDAQGITHHIDIADNTFINCTIGAVCYKPMMGTHDISFFGNRVSGCKTGLASEAIGTAFLGNVLDGSPLDAINCDAARIIGNVLSDSYIYADTGALTTPAGHVLMNNVAPAIYTDHAMGATVSTGNVTGELNK